MAHVLTFIRKLMPYESVWLIFLKVLVLNPLPGRIVTDMIRKKNAKGEIASSPFRWWALADVSVERLESILQFKSGELNNSFIENVVKNPPRAYGYEIRHCSECLAKKYHTSIFSLSLIKSCPWHGCDLFRCSDCHHLLRCFQGGSYGRLSLHLKPENICDHLLHFLTGFPISEFSLAEFGRASIWLEAFRQWIDSAEALIGYDIHEVLALDHYNEETHGLLLKYLEQNLGNPCSLAYDIPYPVKRFITPQHKRGWLKNLEKRSTHRTKAENYFREQCRGQILISPTDMIASLRALRRYIKKTYVRPHRACLQAVSKLSQAQAMNLDPASTCGCAIAYVAWQVQLLEVETLMQVFSNSKKHYKLPKGALHYPISLFHVDLVERLLGFMGIWGAIEVLTESGRYSTIVLSSLTIRSNFFSATNYAYKVLPRAKYTENWPLDYGHYVVDPDFLLQKSRSKCFGGSAFLGSPFDSVKDNQPGAQYFVSNALHIFRYKIANVESVRSYHISV